GRPVAEPQQVRIESAELTDAVGRLLARSRRPGRAAAVLRDRARRDLSGPLGLPLDAPADVVVDALTPRTDLRPDEVRRATPAPWPACSPAPRGPGGRLPPCGTAPAGTSPGRSGSRSTRPPTSSSTRSRAAPTSDPTRSAAPP